MLKVLRWTAAMVLSFCFSTFSTSLAAPQLHDLDISVVLKLNGDAQITERRQMDIDNTGTECYISISNLNGRRITDLTVSDETGVTYTNVGNWDVDRSRQWKTERCGTVRTSDGYELCWGLGESGQRTYITSYTVTELLRGYSDADGFNYMFVARDIKPSPEHARITITHENGTPLTVDNCAIWGFRFDGSVEFVNGSIVAETNEPLGSNGAMIVMARFQKGVFQPSDVSNDSFENVKIQAMEGSDYNDDDDEARELLLFVAFVIGLGLICLGLYLYYVWYQRRKVLKDLMWYRDIPFNGNLQYANEVLNAYSYGSGDYNNLLSACILKLVENGSIGIEQTLNAKGKQVQNFIIHDLKDSKNESRVLHMIHKIFHDAAGQDTILEPKELKSWMKSKYNQSYTDSFIQTLHTKTSIYQYKHELDEVRQLFGLKKFLKEFSLLDERHIGEVSLWKDYMVYATLFGIADQVIKDMKKINPEYFNMDKVAQQMADDMTLPTIYSTMQRSTSRAAMNKAEREARASGRGGRSSWGGGGGFSGGGFGGGVR